jgi:hypothetical protein
MTPGWHRWLHGGRRRTRQLRDLRVKKAEVVLPAGAVGGGLPGSADGLTAGGELPTNRCEKFNGVKSGASRRSVHTSSRKLIL